MSRLKVTDIEVSSWLNVENDYKIPRGKIIAVHAFQMLCPGCVLHGTPQAQNLSSAFDDKHVEVIGLHTVFEHHEAMTETSLKAFLHEFRVRFPVGIDVAGNESIPKTMRKFQLRGTPSWLIFDREGELRIQSFGKIEDLVLGAEISRLALEGMASDTSIVRKKQ